MTRKERRKRKEKRILNCVFIIVIICVFFYIGTEVYKEKKQEQENYYQVKKLIIEEYTNNKNNEVSEKVIENKEYPKEPIEEKYKGYNVLAKLEIPQIELETYIINFSESALNISVTKFWGPNPNEVGNLCIAGHNFKNKNMFHNLRKLQIGDKLTIKDNKIGVIEYEIYNIYTVVPEDVTCLSQETEERREVTLITCTNDSKKRIIIKAREANM